MSTHARSHRGFTLLEVMTSVVILTILAALAVTYGIYGTGRAQMNNAVFDATALIQSARLRAISRGSPQAIFIHQTPDHRVHLQVLELAEDTPTPNWNALDLTPGPELALAFTRTRPDGTVETIRAPIRDELVLGARIGTDSSGLAFLDLDSTRVHKPLPAPFNAIPLTTPLTTPANLNKPTLDLLAGCNFCVENAGHRYGVLRFDSDGSLQVMTGNTPSGAVIAFAPNTEDEQGFEPKLLTVSAPVGATVVF